MKVLRTTSLSINQDSHVIIIKNTPSMYGFHKTFRGKIMFVKFKLFILCCLFSFHQPTFSASFDCAKAHSQIEKMICTDPQLSKLDSELLPIYQKARKANNNSKAFRDNGKKALRWRSKNCKDKACLVQWYQDRKAELLEISQTHSMPSANKKYCVTDGQSITLTGMLRRNTYPGPPNFTSTLEGDELRTYWVLVIPKPMCSFSRSLETDKLEKIEPQKYFHLVITKYTNAYKQLLNQKVKITATPYTRHTAYHQTPLLLEVETMVKAP